MDERQAGRGYLPEDERWFSSSGKEKFDKAAQDIAYLIDHSYDLKKAVEFCGNHYLLSSRQRMALARCSASKSDLALRTSKELSELKGRAVTLDGFNQIITMETYLCKGTLLKGRDGCIRDLAGLRGSYHEIPETKDAIRLILNKLKEPGPASITFLFDRQVSNSGRLKMSTLETAEELGMTIQAETTTTCDTDLKQSEVVITSDSIILNECNSWYDLLSQLIPDAVITYSLHQ